LPLHTIKCWSVVFTLLTVHITLKLLVTNFVSISLEQQTTPLTCDECHQPATVWQSCVCNTWRSNGDNTRCSQILAKNHDFCLPHLHLTPLLGGPSRNCDITFSVRILWVPDSENILKMFVLSPIYKCDEQMDRQTPHDGIGRAHAQHFTAMRSIR